jgi:putative ABC transport system substrate-binding protein
VRKRQFLGAFGAALAWPLAAPLTSEAQGPAARIALIGPDEEPRYSEIAAGLRRGLQDLGYREDAIRFLEGRTARGKDAEALARIQALAKEEVAVFFVIGSALVGLVRMVAPQAAIVFVTPGDPVAAGLVASLARPGGKMTAMTFEYPELSGKRLELLRELSPRIKRVLALYDGRDASPRQGAAAARAAAAALGMSLVERQVSNADEIAAGLKALDGADALLGIPGGVTAAHYATMIAAANARRLPSILYTRTRSTREALLTYGASDVDVARQAARLVDKILKGANAGDLPVERPAKLTLVVNSSTAKTLGIAVPHGLVLRADQVIE